MSDNDLVYVSLGAGVQSSALLVMSALGLRGCPRADFAVFADTQDEPAWVYEYVELLKAWAEPRGLPVRMVTAGRLSDDPIVRVPAYVNGEKGPAPLRQNCTRDYKLTPIRLEVRREMRERGVRSAAALIGISLDEADRMKPARRKWLTNVYPLVDAMMRRHHCADLLREQGLPVPRKSACVFCPWRSRANWREVQIHDPSGWAKAVEYDERIRLERSASVHRSMIPLRNLDFTAQRGWDEGDGFSNDCEGACGV